MDKDVLLICPVCKIITDGIGSGDPTDSVKCKKCNKESFARLVTVKYKNSASDEGFAPRLNEKALYIPVNLVFC